MQGPGGLVRPDVEARGGEDGPLVEPLRHAHDLDAGLSVAGHDGALDGGCAAPAGQEGGVQVEGAQARRLQHLAGQDLAVGDHHGGVEGQGPEGLDLGRVAHRGGGADGQAQGVRQGLHRRGAERLAASAGRRGLGVDRRDLMARGGDGLQAGGGDVRGPEEGEAHGRGLPLPRRRGNWKGRDQPVRASLRTRATARSRFSRERWSMKRTPLRWSISCWMQTAKRPWASSVTSLP